MLIRVRKKGGETMRGRPRKEVTRSHSVGARITEDQYKRLAELCERTGWKESDVVRVGIEAVIFANDELPERSENNGKTKRRKQ